ncbi:hypothetical protein B5G54_19450 [Ralstonia solanacearum]|nr:hypothetical protein B5G54_19450 [Ralstonia solanacearum]OPK56303.1 hypothetical protein B5J95_10935 [Ralstonia solanacearum]OPK60651.1 hypothetical protein B5S37_02570 [Ralstonia solanacearum]OYQ05843.1 hypothetical protein B7R79_06775 [Ralstonia solanacearum]
MACGQVVIDTVHDLARCGFDSFALKPGHDPEAALKALSTFSASYQRAYAMPARHQPPAVFVPAQTVCPAVPDR